MHQIPSSVLRAYASAVTTLIERRHLRKAFHWAYGTEGGALHFTFYTRQYRPNLGQIQDQARANLRELHRLRRAQGLSADLLRTAARESFPGYFASP